MAEKNSRPQKSWASTGKGGREKSWSSDLESFDFKEHKDKYIKVRLLTQSLTEKLHWVYLDVKNAVRHAQGEKLNFKTAPSFPVVCPDFDPYKEEGTPNKCPVCLHFSSYSRPSLSYYCWAFVGIPSKKKGGEDRWLEDPVVLKLGTGIVIGIQNTIALRGGVDPADPIEGYYINIMAKGTPNGPNDAYVVQAGESMKLTKSQRLAVKELPDLFEAYKPTSAESIKASLTQKGYYGLLEEDAHDMEEDDEDGESIGKKKKKADKKKKKHVEDDADDDEDSEEDGDEEDDSEDEEDVKPSKKSKKKSRYEEDEESEDDDESDDEESDDADDEDEEEIRPSKKNKKSSKPEKKASKKSSKYSDEDEESDDDSEDDDSDDEIPAPKNSSIAKKKKLKDAGKKKSRRDIDEDDD